MKEAIVYHPTSIGSGFASSIPDEVRKNTTYTPPETHTGEEATIPIEEESTRKTNTWRRSTDEQGRPIILIEESE